MNSLDQIPKGVLRYRHAAMATDWEIYAAGVTPADAGFAVAEAWKAVDLVEDELSHFVTSSDIARINRLASGASTVVSPDTMACLTLAHRIHRETGGVFDLTVGALLKGRKAWRDQEHGVERVVEPDHPVVVGMHLLTLDEETLRVGVKDQRVSLDLGGIGKGFALDRASQRLREWDLNRFLLQGGQSTFILQGACTGTQGWPMRWIDPRDEKTVLDRCTITDCAVSVSSNATQSHILDPQTLQPVPRRWVGAWVFAPTGAEADALSTAFMAMKAGAIETYCRSHTTIAAIMAVESDVNKPLSLRRFGNTAAYHVERK